MRHEWVFEVLADLVDYAERNGLPRLAQIADEALVVARDEIGGRSRGGGSGSDDDTPSLH